MKRFAAIAVLFIFAQAPAEAAKAPPAAAKAPKAAKARKAPALSDEEDLARLDALEAELLKGRLQRPGSGQPLLSDFREELELRDATATVSTDELARNRGLQVLPENLDLPADPED